MTIPIFSPLKPIKQNKKTGKIKMVEKEIINFRELNNKLKRKIINAHQHIKNIVIG